MKSIRVRKYLITDRQLHNAAEKLRKAFGKLPRIGKSFWKHDDVNLVELYDDCKSDQEFIDYWTMSHRRYMWKHNPDAAAYLYPKKQ